MAMNISDNGGVSMRYIRKDQVVKPFENYTGEKIYEMIGAPVELGEAKYHSFGHTVIPPNCMSRLHYHPIAEETYYILKGKAKITIDEQTLILEPEDAVLIQQNEKHQIFNVGDEDLEFLVICAPAWEPNNSVYLDE